MQGNLDVFLSYHWREQSEVKELAQRLRELYLALALQVEAGRAGKKFPVAGRGIAAGISESAHLGRLPRRSA